MQLISIVIAADFNIFSAFTPGIAVADLKKFCCQNPECPDYGQRDKSNLRVGFRYGADKQRRMLVCRTCQQKFSERKGTALFHCKLSDEKAVSVLQHLQESCGVLQTSRLVGVNKNTVVRLAVVAGQHAKECHDELVAFSPSDSGGSV
jgi:transposase-like protein